MGIYEEMLFRREVDEINRFIAKYNLAPYAFDWELEQRSDCKCPEYENKGDNISICLKCDGKRRYN